MDLGTLSCGVELRPRRSIAPGAHSVSARRPAQAYAREHALSAADLGWLFATQSGEERARSRGAWNSIAAALPHRRIKAVWSCGTRMFHGANYQARKGSPAYPNPSPS
jgi:hypothetical protein